ncbi:MAG: hypothetical protein AABX02_04010 [archaeon]
MSAFSPVFDLALALLVVVGSPSLGYILIRFAFPFTSTWLGWKRAVTAGIVGIGWSVLLIVIALPAVQGEKISPALIGEWAWWGGLGIMGVAFLSRGVVHMSMRGLARPTFSGAEAPMHEKTNVSSKSNRPAQNEWSEEKTPVYKPSQIRPSMNTNPKEEMDEPILENDVLELLKEEKPESNKGTSSENEESNPQLVEFGRAESFEDTLEQLKRDLKDFNESMTQSPHKKGETNHE